MPATAWSASAEILLKPELCRIGSYVTLGEIAQVRSSSEELRRVLVLHGIAVRSPVGVPVRLSRAQLARQIADVTDGVVLEWRGGKSVEVLLRGQTVAAQTIGKIATDHLAQTLAVYGEQVRVSVINKPADKIVQEGTLQLIPRITSAELRSRMCVYVDAWVDGARVASIPVWHEVDIPAKVAVASVNLEKGEPLSTSHVRIEERNLATISGAPVMALNTQERMRIKRPLAAGEVLRKEDLDFLPPVVRGQSVKVIVQAPGVVLETVALAAQDGELGQRIKVEHPDKHASFFAKVTGMGEVTAHE